MMMANPGPWIILPILVRNTLHTHYFAMEQKKEKEEEEENRNTDTRWDMCLNTWLVRIPSVSFIVYFFFFFWLVVVVFHRKKNQTLFRQGFFLFIFINSLRAYSLTSLIYSETRSFYRLSFFCLTVMWYYVMRAPIIGSRNAAGSLWRQLSVVIWEKGTTAASGIYLSTDISTKSSSSMMMGTMNSS
jgi:hypothetical protein